MSYRPKTDEKLSKPLKRKCVDSTTNRELVNSSKLKERSQMSKNIPEVSEALKKAGRGGWRVNFDAIFKVTDKFIAEQKKKYTVSETAETKKKSK